MSNPIVVVCLLVAGFLGFQPTSFSANRYPEKPVRLVVGFPAGGGSDSLARIAGAALSDLLGARVIVDNRPGAGGVIATEMVMGSESDGYTVLFTSLTHVVNPAVYAKVNYDPIKDFAPVVQFVSFPFILVVNPGYSAKSVDGLLEAARKKPGALLYASAGNGTTSHLSMELLQSMAKVRFEHVPFKGAAAQMLDLMAGRIQFGFASPGAGVPHINAGRLRALAITGPKPNPLLPGVPTVAETVANYEVLNWFGFLMRAGAPRAVVQKFNAAVNESLKRKDVLNGLAAQMTDPVGGTAANFARLIESENRKWPAVVKAAGMKPG